VCVCVCVPRAIRSTLMMRMMVGLIGSEALISISSSVMPITESSTMARSSWFHLHTHTHTHTHSHTHTHTRTRTHAHAHAHTHTHSSDAPSLTCCDLQDEMTSPAVTCRPSNSLIQAPPPPIHQPHTGPAPSHPPASYRLLPLPSTSLIQAPPPPPYLSLKKRLNPKATSFRDASITKVEVKK